MRGRGGGVCCCGVASAGAHTFLPTCLAGAISSRLPGLPGSEPLTTRAPFSASTASTSTFRILARTLPICAAAAATPGASQRRRRGSAGCVGDGARPRAALRRGSNVAPQHGAAGPPQDNRRRCQAHAGVPCAHLARSLEAREHTAGGGARAGGACRQRQRGRRVGAPRAGNNSWAGSPGGRQRSRQQHSSCLGQAGARRSAGRACSGGGRCTRHAPPPHHSPAAPRRTTPHARTVLALALGAVRHVAARKAPALDAALEALADGGARNVNQVARLARRQGERGARNARSACNSRHGGGLRRLRRRLLMQSRPAAQPAHARDAQMTTQPKQPQQQRQRQRQQRQRRNTTHKYHRHGTAQAPPGTTPSTVNRYMQAKPSPKSGQHFVGSAAAHLEHFLHLELLPGLVAADVLDLRRMIRAGSSAAPGAPPGRPCAARRTALLTPGAAAAVRSCSTRVSMSRLAADAPCRQQMPLPQVVP